MPRDLIKNKMNNKDWLFEQERKQLSNMLQGINDIVALSQNEEKNIKMETTNETNSINIKDIVSNNNMAVFTHAIAGFLYYTVTLQTGEKYQFPVDMNDKDDVGTTTFDAEIKAITLMRYIRKSKENDLLIKVG